MPNVAAAGGRPAENGATPGSESSRRRRLGWLLRPLLRAQGGLQRRRRGRGAVAERAREVSCIVICRKVMWQ